MQHRVKGEFTWYDYDKETFVNGDPFGPWNSADCYEWRIKPETTSIKFRHEKIVVEEFEFDFEGVKNTFYEKGEIVYYIFKNDSGLFCCRIDCSINHDQTTHYYNHVFFTSKEYLYKAWERIPNHLKGI